MRLLEFFSVMNESATSAEAESAKILDAMDKDGVDLWGDYKIDHDHEQIVIHGDEDEDKIKKSIEKVTGKKFSKRGSGGWGLMDGSVSIVLEKDKDPIGGTDMWRIDITGDDAGASTEDFDEL